MQQKFKFLLIAMFKFLNTKTFYVSFLNCNVTERIYYTVHVQLAAVELRQTWWVLQTVQLYLPNIPNICIQACNVTN